MIKKTLVTLALLSMTSCLTIETPEHLVSDTVEVGKDAYHAIVETLSDEEPTASNNKEFEFEYTVHNGESIESANANCIKAATEEARKAMNVYNVQIEKITVGTATGETKKVIQCSVILKG